MNKKEIDPLWNPDTLELTKQDVLDFLNAIILRQKKNPKPNIKLTSAIHLMKFGIKMYDEKTIQIVWGEILSGFNLLLYENAIAKMKKQNIPWAVTKEKIKKKIAGELS